VEVTRMSTCLRCAASSSNRMATPPSRSARGRACSRVRLHTTTVPQPASRRCRTVSSAISPAPRTSTPPAGQPAQQLAGQVHRRGGHGKGAAFDPGLLADPAACGDGVPEQAVQEGAGGLGRPRGPRRPPAPGRGSAPRPPAWSPGPRPPGTGAGRPPSLRGRTRRAPPQPGPVRGSHTRSPPPPGHPWRGRPPPRTLPCGCTWTPRPPRESPPVPAGGRRRCPAGSPGKPPAPGPLQARCGGWCPRRGCPWRFWVEDSPPPPARQTA
jgi:hypothetical protein